MKEEEISTLNYHFHYYFDYCIHENTIQVISHHFSNNNEKYDIRTAFMPTVNGENIVLRILKSYQVRIFTN